MLMYVYISQAGINSRGLMNAVDIKIKTKINAVSTDILNTQRVDGSMLYDACELSFNNVDKTRVLKINNDDILQSISHNDVAVNVYNKPEIDIGLTLNLDKSTTCLNTDVDVFLSSLQAGIYRRVLIHDVDINCKFQNSCYNK